jgi:hypothetical protein
MSAPIRSRRGSIERGREGSPARADGRSEAQEVR